VIFAIPSRVLPNHRVSYEEMPMHDKQKDPPLPATVAFVIGLGIFFVIGWLLMFRLLTVRW
jgi:hypothetical protein